MAIGKGADGLYHPKTEAEIIELVKAARADGKELRCRGSAHSVSHAIYTDPLADLPNRVNQETGPETDNYMLMLDQYRGIELIDEEKRIVAVDAGANLGIDPFDPTGTSTWENSMLQRLAEDYGWTVANLGGIDFQTVGGFTTTGSSGGSITYSIHDNLHGLRLIDGTGEVYTVMRDDADPSDFYAAGVSLGLLGITSKIYLQCEPLFNIVGQEASTTLDGASMSLFGDDGDKRPSIQSFLKDVEYTRLMWWPQKGIEQVVTWQAKRLEPFPGFRRAPYQEFSNYPNVGEPVASIFYILIGNYADLDRVKPELDNSFRQLSEGIVGYLENTFLKKLAKPIAGAVSWLGHKAIRLASFMGKKWMDKNRPKAFAWFINTFQKLDSQKGGMDKDTPQSFQDWGWKGLPMDNSARDDLMPTEFTEIWIPVDRAQSVLRLIRDYFDGATDEHDAYERTGYYAIELYGSKPNPFWMSMAHTDGEDEWKNGVIRLDIFWFEFNPGNPAELFFPRFWNLLREHNVPNRLHWGKYRPVIQPGDPDGWVDYYKAQFPQWDEWLAYRAEKDPDGIFLNSYWRTQLGLEKGVATVLDEPLPEVTFDEPPTQAQQEQDRG